MSDQGKTDYLPTEDILTFEDPWVPESSPWSAPVVIPSVLSGTLDSRESVEEIEIPELPDHIESALREIYGRYLPASGLQIEIGHDSENFIERNGDDDFLSSGQFYFVDADAETRAKSSKYLQDVFGRLDKRTGQYVECLTVTYFLHLYRSLWESDRDIVYKHLRLHGWRLLPCNKIEYVDRGLGEKGCSHFAIHFRNHLPLREVNFSGNKLGKCNNLHILIMSLGSLRSITKLNFSNNEIVLSSHHRSRRKNTNLINSILQCIKHRRGTLKCINFADNKISGIYIEKILTEINGLIEMNFSNNKLTCDDCVAIGRGLAAKTSCLRKLLLRKNRISSIGVAAISCGIREKGTKTLEYIDFSHNPLGAPGAIALGDMVRDCNHIKALIVKDCQLTYILPSDPKQISRQKDAQAFEKFIGCLGYNRSITALNLSHNRCHSNEKEGATIGQMLGRLMTLGNLTSVDISWMNLGSQAVEHIAEQLYEMSYARQLEKLKLNFCKK